jgi:UPF0755 protein
MKNPRSRRNSFLTWSLLAGGLILLSMIAAVIYIPSMSRQIFGPPADSLNLWQRFSYGLRLGLFENDMTRPLDWRGAEEEFTIQPDESVTSISARLEQAGLIRSAETFRVYLIWTGLDTIIRSGVYQLSPAQSGQEIAQALKTTSQVSLTVFPGWRMDEIAAAIPTSGLAITPQAFLAEAVKPVSNPTFTPAGANMEGFLSPGVYTLDRSTTADQLVYLLVQNFFYRLTPEMQSGFTSHGLSLYQAVTLASIIQREAMVEAEMPMIASVLYNRMAIDMPLQTDPTVQYALGYNAAQSTWWTSPLSEQDLAIDSPYNTYEHPGLPPGPISNPGLAALAAVAAPAESNYYYFQARCDGSGLHNFAETLEEHAQNNCP